MSTIINYIKGLFSNLTKKNIIILSCIGGVILIVLIFAVVIFIKHAAIILGIGIPVAIIALAIYLYLKLKKSNSAPPVSTTPAVK